MPDILDRLTAALADRYRVERELGQGGMATVYLAEDLKHKRKVALKVLKPELAAVLGADRFVQEITTTAALQHPHILPLFDSGRTGGLGGERSDEFLYYVMPFIEGETLRARLNRETQLGIDEAVKIATAVADALDYAHRHGVIHRDIKPENILLHEGRPMVADFGIALAVSAAAGGRMTETGLSLGTPHYMSPEQATAEKEITARSDVYSLASVLYEMLTGSPPHVGASAQQIIMKIVTDPVRPVTELRKSVPPHVAAAVAQALEKLPADRFESARAFADALGNPGYTTTRGTQARPAGSPARRSALTTALAVSTILLAAAVVWLARRPGGGTLSAGTTRFVAAMETATGFASTSTVTVGPDNLLVIGAQVGTQAVLLARPLDRLAGTIIPGSEGASRAFLSADGRWVAFQARGKLVKLPIEGGTPVTLADSTQWGGGSWGEDGTIIYSRSYQSGLWQVSSAGGDARPISTPDSAAGELAHWWPQLLPGGRYVLFTAYRTPIERATIEVLDRQTGKRQVVMQNGITGRYTASGHLLFAREGSILAVPFDLDARAVAGAPVVAADDVAMTYSDGFAAYDVSPSGTLVMLPSAVVGSRYQVVEVDRRGAERVLVPDADRYQNPRFAPDHRRFAFDLTPSRAARDVWVVDPARGARTRVTTEAASDFGALWTPDGRDLIYMSERPLFELWRRAADGSRPPSLLVGGQHDRILGDISADGQVAVFVLSVVQGSDLWTVNLEGAPVPRQYLANGFQLAHPALSPDGRWMAYDSDETGRVEVYIQSYPDPTVAKRQVTTGGGGEPLWTRGGRELVFRRGDSVMAVPVDPATATTGNAVALFTGQWAVEPDWTDPRSWDVTPDGERFLLLKWPAGRVQPRVVVATNWWPELRALVAAGTRR